MRDNVDTYVADMHAQTGKIPGAPTKLCHALIVGALRRGARLDPTSHHSLGPTEQIEVEREHDLFRARISLLVGSVTQVNTGDFLDELLLSEVSYDAILLAGYAAVGAVRGGHGIAIVKTEDSEGGLAIVDSLVDGGLLECNLDYAAAHIRERFDGPAEEWYLLLNQATAQPLVGARRRMDVDSTGFISAYVDPLRESPQ